eukprot:scaffold108544_cov50-Phaeocystis_antarctica.AAC.4
MPNPMPLSVQKWHQGCLELASGSRRVLSRRRPGASLAPSFSGDVEASPVEAGRLEASDEAGGAAEGADAVCAL